MQTQDKVAVVNALMQEDRAEIRMNKSAVVNTTYYVVSGIVAVTAFAISQKSTGGHVSLYLVGIWSLFALYIATFFWYKKHLFALRKCLDIREKYYKEPKLLENEEPFSPLKNIDDATPPRYRVDYLYFLPVITLIVALANTSILLSIF